VRSEESGVRREGPTARIQALALRAAWLFVALTLLLVPLFAHGCHGDDVDHEPLVVPLRLNPEDR
jgi:hypothetical protein